MKDTIIIHCSATRAGQDFTATDIDRWHRQRGFRSIGYHFVIRLDGTIEPGRDVALDGAHCTGWNHRSIGICYNGGLDRNGRPADTRTEAQREALVRLDEDFRLFRVDADRKIVQRDLHNVLAHALRVLGVVGRRLCVRNHDVSVDMYSGILQLHALGR